MALNSGTPTITNSMAHAPGIAQRDASTSATTYLHGNLIGTTEVMSNSVGNITRRTIFTAFGEPVYENGSPDSRFGYCGEFGYQEAGAADPLGELGWLHVGHRYYDPSVGRFMQRDPIGIRGGANTYAYTDNAPVIAVDPLGLWSWKRAIVGATGGVLAGTFRGGPAGALVWGLCGALAGYDPGDEQPLINLFTRSGFFEHVDAYNRANPDHPIIVFCLAEGTPVVGQDGELCVEDIKPGEVLLTSVPAEHVIQPARVTRVVKSWTLNLVQIVLQDESISTTDSHPFWVIGRGWVKAGDMRVGDRLLGFDNFGTTIIDVRHEHLDKPIQVYDISVDGDHTFFVGKSKVLVHNKNA